MRLGPVAGPAWLTRGLRQKWVRRGGMSVAASPALLRFPGAHVEG